jgi:hypothetical protein
VLIRAARAVGLVAIVACATARNPGNSGDGPPNGSDAAKSDGKTPDMSNGCSVQPCSILPQCGCPMQACDLNHMTLMGNACRMITSPGHETDACTSSVGCDAGYVCLSSGSCKKYCSDTSQCGSPRGQCVIDITDSTGTVIAGLPSVCSSNCDPAGATGCASGLKCNLYTQTHMGTSYNIVDCAKAGTGGQNFNCKPGANADDTLCASGFLCTTLNSTTYACRKICPRPAGTGCSTPANCIAFSTPFTIAGQEYGVCNPN